MPCRRMEEATSGEDPQHDGGRQLPSVFLFILQLKMIILSRHFPLRLSCLLLHQFRENFVIFATGLLCVCLCVVTICIDGML